MARHLAFLVCFAVAAAGSAASADHAPTIVVPGRADVPVTIDGRNAAWTVVEGEWGLYRPGHMAPTIIGRAQPPARGAPPARYFPRYGLAPDRGRHEIEPPADRSLPEPAESFFRYWSSQTEREPAEARHADLPRPPTQSLQGAPDAVTPTSGDPLSMTPPIIVVPRIQGGRPRP